MRLSRRGRIEFADSGSAEVQPLIEHPRLRRMDQPKSLNQKPEAFDNGAGAEAAQIPRREVPVEVAVPRKKRLRDLVQSSAQIGPVKAIDDRLFPIRDLDVGFPGTVSVVAKNLRGFTRTIRKRIPRTRGLRFSFRAVVCTQVTRGTCSVRFQ